MSDYGPLVELIVTATLTIVVVSRVVSIYGPALINVVILLSISVSMLIYGILMNLSAYEVVYFLWRIVFNSEQLRYFLLMFWLFNVFASVGFVVFVNVRGRSSTIHRKFFHLTVSLIYLSGLYCDKDFVWLSGWLMICLFVIVEVLRFFKVPPWEKTLNRSLLAFKDEQDSAVLLTPIFLLLGASILSYSFFAICFTSVEKRILLIGVFLPLFLSPSDTSPHLYHLAGVAAVGVGDSVAAIVGSKWGRTRWPGKKKTVEGSTAMALAVLMFLLLARPFCSSPRPSCTRIAVVSFVLSAVEALTTNIDNIILPTIGYLLL